MVKKQYTKEELWEGLDKIYKQKQDRITVSDINNADFTANYIVHLRHIGTIDEINKEYNEYEPSNKHKVYSNKEMLSNLKEVIFAFGEDFTVTFFNSLGIAKYQTYVNRYGSMDNAIRKAKDFNYKIQKIFL